MIALRKRNEHNNCEDYSIVNILTLIQNVRQRIVTDKIDLSKRLNPKIITLTI